MRLPTDFQNVYREVAARLCLHLDRRTVLLSHDRPPRSARREPVPRCHAPVIARAHRPGTGDTPAPLSAASLRVAGQFAAACHRSGPVRSPLRPRARGLETHLPLGNHVLRRHVRIARTIRAIGYQKKVDIRDGGQPNRGRRIGPRSVGLPNIGVPAPVPLVDMLHSDPHDNSANSPANGTDRSSDPKNGVRSEKRGQDQKRGSCKKRGQDPKKGIVRKKGVRTRSEKRGQDPEKG